MDHDETPSPPSSSGRWVALGMAGLLGVALVAYQGLKAPPEAVPAEVAADPLLARGREIYQERCVSCHGPRGRGNGPLASGLPGPRVRNLAGEPWKHGDRPEDVLLVLENGVKDAQMPAWGGTYGPDDLKAVAAYVYHLAARPIPEGLRSR